MTLIDPSNFSEPTVMVALITTIGTILVTLLALAGEAVKRKLDAIHEHTEASREQVQNSHSTNLREDIDRIHEDVRAVLGMTERNTEAIQSLAHDLRIERLERIKVAEKVDDALIPKAVRSGDDAA